MQVLRKDDTALVELSGRIIFDNLVATQMLLTELAGAGLRRVYLKMDDLRYLDSSALGMLLNFNTTAEAAGTSIAILSPPSHIQAMFRCAHLDRIFTILGEGEAKAVWGDFIQTEAATLGDTVPPAAPSA